MEPEGSLSHPQASATCLLGQLNPVHIPTSHLLEIHPNIIHPSTPRRPQWSLSLRLPHQEPTHPLYSPIRATCPAHLITISNNKGKGKAVPLQAWSGPEGSMKLRFPDFITTAQDGGKVVSLTHRPPLSPGNTPGTHFC